ncbi:MAG: hypothetical protein ACKO6I_07125 [Sphingomonadales bacterium]|nr:hypothetical protein [Sphingomonadales bacterium]
MRKTSELKSVKFTHFKQQIQFIDGSKFALKAFLLRNKIPFNDKSTLLFNGHIYYLRSECALHTMQYAELIPTVKAA